MSCIIFEAAAAAGADVLSPGALLCVNALPATFLASGLDAGLSNTLDAILAIFEPVPFFIYSPPEISTILTPNLLNAKKKHSLRGKKRIRDPLKIWRNKAWKEFSIYVRKGAADWKGFTSCFTCPKYAPWQEFDAGHYKHGVMDFNPKNINPQCTSCNRFWHGRLDSYASALLKKFGVGILDELDRGAVEARRRKDQFGYEYTKEELINIYERYKRLNEQVSRTAKTSLST